MPPQPLAFNELRDLWYGKIKEAGFEDIESSPDPESPLKEWHSFKFISENAQIRKQKRSGYQAQIDSFANLPEFQEILKLLSKHGNSKFSARGIEYIWFLHRDGVSERRIAAEMNCSQTCVHFMLRRIREWMRLVS